MALLEQSFHSRPVDELPSFLDGQGFDRHKIVHTKDTKDHYRGVESLIILGENDGSRMPIGACYTTGRFHTVNDRLAVCTERP